MNKTTIHGSLLLLILAIPFIFISFANGPTLSPEESCRAYVLNNISKIQKHLYNCSILAEEGLGKAQIKQLKKELSKTKNTYRQIEFFIEYFNIPNPDNKNEKIIELKHFDQIEDQLLLKENAPVAILLADINLVRNRLQILKTYYKTIPIKSVEYQESLTLHTQRLQSITFIANGTIFTKVSITQYTHSLESLRDNIANFKSMATDQQKKEIVSILQHINCAIYFLEEQSNSTNPDLFATKFLVPIYKEVYYLFNASDPISQQNTI